MVILSYDGIVIKILANFYWAWMHDRMSACSHAYITCSHALVYQSHYTGSGFFREHPASPDKIGVFHLTFPFYLVDYSHYP
jgi:hypothetical protein